MSYAPAFILNTINVSQLPIFSCKVRFSSYVLPVGVLAYLTFYSTYVQILRDYFIIYVCVSMYVYVQSCSIHGGQRRVSDILELEFWMVVNHLMGCWEWNSGFLKGQQALLTAETSF